MKENKKDKYRLHVDACIDYMDYIRKGENKIIRKARKSPRSVIMCGPELATWLRDAESARMLDRFLKIDKRYVRTLTKGPEIMPVCNQETLDILEKIC